MLPVTDTTLVRSASVLTSGHTNSIPVEVRSLSQSEALIVAKLPLEEKRMMLMLETEGHEPLLLDADVLHRSEYHQGGLIGRDIAYSACRLRFRRMMPIADMHESLLAAFGISNTAECDRPETEEEPAPPSLVPLLSAVGILVVYCSQQPWSSILQF